MNRLHVGGIGLASLGLIGYGIGVAQAYPGRAFSIAAVMLGLTLLGVNRLESVRGAQ